MLPKFLQIFNIYSLFFLTNKNDASSSSVAIAKGKQPVVETSQVPAAETTQALPSPRSIMLEDCARMKNISRNVDTIVGLQWRDSRPGY